MFEKELLPCPFCGGKARMDERGIVCTPVNCGAMMRYPFLGASVLALIEAWNKRV